jgi:hypothetical protein
VKKKAFFRNFVTLVLFGVLGTMMTSALIFAGVYPLLRWLGVGAHLVPDALSLGTIFSSSDSVATLQILDQVSGGWGGGGHGGSEGACTGFMGEPAWWRPRRRLQQEGAPLAAPACFAPTLLQDAAPVLYSLVFGEGVVNDATSIVLLRAVQKIRYANA